MRRKRVLDFLRLAEESFDTGFGSFDIEIETDLVAAGVGGAWGISSRSDFFARAALLKADFSVDVDDLSGGDDDTSYGLELGLRGQVGDATELFGTVSHVDVFDEAETGFDVGARYWFTPGFGLSLAYESTDRPTASPSPDVSASDPLTGRLADPGGTFRFLNVAACSFSTADAQRA